MELYRGRIYMMKKYVMYMALFLLVTMFSACLGTDSDSESTENVGSMGEDIVTESETECVSTEDDIPDGPDYFPEVRYNDGTYYCYQLIADGGEEWVNEYSGFVYIGKAEYTDKKNNLRENFTTNYYGGALELYQCNEDSSVIAGCSENGDVALFMRDDVYYSDNRGEIYNAIWRDRQN